MTRIVFYGLRDRGRSRPKKLVRHRQQHPVRPATLKVGSLTGSRELTDSLRKCRDDICCVQKIRRKDSKSRGIGYDYKFIYHGTSNRNGVGALALNKRLETASQQWSS
ncbi:hypothetical protein RB195_018893 [Necator americanus]|uniref:PARP catalytic domain-containing protein n=1 Tax=Necator americanus TaxID=51031 RepID=A0ABR1CCS7_NECAM